MIVVDYYSRWIEILHVTNITSAAGIAKLKDIFARYGIPAELVSDNGPHFASAEFRSFAKEYGFKSITVSPRLPNANGEAERAVKTAKQILCQKDPWLGLMIYRDTVIAATGHSPSLLMLGRHIRTTLPTLPAALKPSWPNPDLTRLRDQQAKESYEHQYNRRHGVRQLPNLCKGDVVKIKTDTQKNWTSKGVIAGDAGTPRSYTVDTDSGTYRRNRRHLQDTGKTRVEPELNQILVVPASNQITRMLDNQTQHQYHPMMLDTSPVALRRSTRAIKKPDRLIEHS